MRSSFVMMFGEPIGKAAKPRVSPRAPFLGGEGSWREVRGHPSRALLCNCPSPRRGDPEPEPEPSERSPLPPQKGRDVRCVNHQSLSFTASVSDNRSANAASVSDGFAAGIDGETETSQQYRLS